MKFKPYPRYKDSGIEWLGEVPEYWEVKRAKYLFNLVKRPVINSHGIVTAFRDGQVTLRTKRRVTGFTNAIKEIGYQGVKKGDLIIHAMDAFAGAIGISDSDGKCSPVYSCCISKDGVSSLFFAKMLRAMALSGYVESLAKGIRERSTDFRWTDFSEQFLPTPPLSEQTAIANFLDRETSRIDGLIDEKNRFIELLKEKRQTLISHAITKGLDPTVKMKDSGVDWLGDVPEDWDIKKIKYLFEIRKRIAGKEGYPVLSITQRGIKIKDTISGEGQLAMDYSKYQFVEVGDFAMNHMDLLTGYVDISNFHGVTSPDYRVFVLTDANSVDRYFLYLMQMGYKDKIFYSYGQGVANIGRWRFQTEPFNNFSVPYPNKDEQQQIVDFLDTETSKIDALLQETQVSIELLKEHRTALISAAVTGKIDVREAA